MWLHTVADALVGLSCLAVCAGLLYLAHRHRVKRIAPVFAVFGGTFLVGGLTQTLEIAAMRWGNSWLWYAGWMKLLCGAFCAACAWVTVRCAGEALVSFTRLAVLERRIDTRLAELRTEPRFHNTEDQSWRADLTEVQRMTRYLVELVPTGAADREQGG